MGPTILSNLILGVFFEGGALVPGEVREFPGTLLGSQLYNQGRLDSAMQGICAEEFGNVTAHYPKPKGCGSQRLVGTIKHGQSMPVTFHPDKP